MYAQSSKTSPMVTYHLCSNIMWGQNSAITCLLRTQRKVIKPKLMLMYTSWMLKPNTILRPIEFGSE